MYDYINEPTLADAIMDRLLANASRIELKGESMRRFTGNSDIEWNKTVSEIDQQLYAKYHLTDEEIAFIEKMIKPML